MSEQVAIEVIEAPPVTVEVVEEAGVLVVEVDRTTAVDVVEVIHPGPQGPKGEPGAAFAAYVHSQPNAASTWIINHNRGAKPSVKLFDLGSREIEADVIHVSDNQTMAYFTVPTAGFARLI